MNNYIRISDLVRREVSDFKIKHIQITKGYNFSQYQNIRRINLYINDRYYNRDNGSAIFWNISTPRIIHFAKNIDLDTKDFQPIGKGKTNFTQAWILKMKFKKWLKDNHFSITLNDLSEGLSTYGSIVWKLIKGKNGNELVESDLRNLYFNPTVKTIRKSPVVELHYLSETEILGKSPYWENVEELIKVASKGTPDQKFEQDNVRLYEIWERHGEWVDPETGKTEYYHCIGAGYGEKEVIAYKEKMDSKDMPYYDFHIGRFRGRWQRIGVVERLYKLQERINELVNQNAEATAIASLLLLRTSDPNTTGNVLQGAETGQIITSTDLQQIGIDNRFLSGFINEMKLIEQQADKLCFTPEVVSGEMMPSNTPFRTVATLSNAAKSSFRYIKETIGEQIGFLLIEEILPSVVRKWNKGGILEIMDDFQDIKIYDDALVEKTLELRAEHAFKNGLNFDPSAEEADIRNNLDRVVRKIELPDNFFNFDYGIDLNVTGEQVDKAQQNDAYSNIIQYILQAPTIQNNPYFRQYVENNGITPIRLTQEQLQQETQGMGGEQPDQAPNLGQGQPQPQENQQPQQAQQPQQMIQ